MSSIAASSTTSTIQGAELLLRESADNLTKLDLMVTIITYHSLVGNRIDMLPACLNVGQML